MKSKLRFLIIMVILIGLLTVVIPAESKVDYGVKPSLENSFVPNEILIGIKPAFVRTFQTASALDQEIAQSLSQLNQQFEVQAIEPVFSGLSLKDPVVSKYALAGIYKLVAPPGVDLFLMLEAYRNHSWVDYAELNKTFVALEIPNDTDFNEQWGLNNSGQDGGTSDADIDAPEAWNIETGKSSVLIAILDTGVDYNHPEMSGGRVRKDIDKDFINTDDDAMDDHGHGTYVAGIAAANTNNTSGIAGLCRGCQVLPVKVLDSEGSGTTVSVSQGIQYAADKGAKIISMSLGMASDCGCSQTMARTINYSFEKGSLLIAASGNDYDKQRVSYPASSTRVLSVGATDNKDQETDFSNRASGLDILAPGKDIYSLDLNNGYRVADGTSAAAPHVSGAAGLIWSKRPAFSNAKVWWILYQSADTPLSAKLSQPASSLGNLPTLETAPKARYRIFLGAVSNMRNTFGRLNVFNALKTNISGEMFAPVDTCSSEPSCPPGCGAEVTLAGDGGAALGLQRLRDFRNSVLAGSPYGNAWIDVYERNKVEVALILVSDSKLRQETRDAINAWLPLIAALIENDAQQKAIITPELAESADYVLQALYTQGSRQLRSDIGRLIEDIQIYDRVGEDIREVWWSMNLDSQ